MPTEQEKWEQQRRDRGGGDALAQQLTDLRREGEAAKAEWRASPQGEVARLELEMAELGAQMDEASWRAIWAERGEAAPKKPDEKDLPLSSRNKLLQIRIHEQLAARQTRGNR
jgi:hypothetical protein